MATEVNNANKTISDEEIIVHDFNRRLPYWGYLPTKYRILEHFADLRTELDEYLEKLFSGSIDSGNADILDNIITDVSRKAVKELEKQKTSHCDMIKSFDIRAKSDRKAFGRQLELYKESLEINKHEQEKYKTLSRVNEFL